MRGPTSASEEKGEVWGVASVGGVVLCGWCPVSSGRFHETYPELFHKTRVSKKRILILRCLRVF